jgi:carboxypeptidase Q
MKKTSYQILFMLFAAYFLQFPMAFSQSTAAVAEDEDAFFIRKIYDKGLTESRCYGWLTALCTQIGGRLAGSPEATKAEAWAKQTLEAAGFQARFQDCQVPHWVRGAKEVVRGVNSKILGKQPLRALALGGSVATIPSGLTAEVIEVKSLDEVDALGEKVKGKIVFYNRPMDKTPINTFFAYGKAGDQRRNGASRAAKYGALGVVVRALTTEIDDRPHTGSMYYDDKYPKIPAVAIATLDAENLSKALKTEGTVKLFMKTNCQNLPDMPGRNVIAEIRGSEFPNEVILVGGHLDSWDVAQGAHDDGAGSVQAMEVLNLLTISGYKPKRTIRCVLFANEENGLRGGLKYAEEALKTQEKHIAAIESDAGGFTPRGFSFEGDSSNFKTVFKKVTPFQNLLEPYGLTFSVGGSGADITPLKPQKTLLIGLRPDSQRYFDFHHTTADRIEYVNKRELELGAAAMASLVFLLDKYGL